MTYFPPVIESLIVIIASACVENNGRKNPVFSATSFA